MSELSYLERGRERLAFRRREGAGPGVVWLGGFRSDMEGTKAQALDAWAARTGRAFLRFDYSGHGSSSGDFLQGTISGWLSDALAIIEAQSQGPQILVGSSMGGWIALLAARTLPAAGLLLIAPAADFTEVLMWDEMAHDARRAIIEKGFWRRESAYDGESYDITRALIEDGRRHLVLGERLAPGCPVRILQGLADLDVPWRHAIRVADAIDGDVTVTLVKNGDHRLSTPANLKLLERTLDGLLEDAST